MICEDPKVLLLGGNDLEHSRLMAIAASRATVNSAGDFLEMEELLKDASYDALLCPSSFQGASWRDVLRTVRKHEPDLPVIVFSNGGGEKEWIAVLEAGGFDLVVSPYSDRTVLPVLEQALASYHLRASRNNNILNKSARAASF